MKIKYLGTGAAERIPALFCQCDVCDEARRIGGKEIRTQTQTLIDGGQLLIDFPADSYLHLLTHGLNFNNIKHLLITHWHGDHFYAEDLAYRMTPYANNLEDGLTVYGSSEVETFFDRAFQLEGMTEKMRIKFSCLEPFGKYTIGDYIVHALPANHGHNKGDCLIYVIEKDGKTMLYGHDTGIFSEEVFDYLANEKMVFDFLTLDCTGQGLTYEGGKHMTIYQNVALRERLEKLGLIHDKTLLVASHFSHNGGLNHDEMVKLAESQGVIAAFDGMEINF